jgi:pyruvate carboxylase
MKEPTGNIVLVVDHTPYQTRSTTKFARHREYQRQDPLKVVAHIPGLIVEICCKAGDKIQREDRLAVLDAMKMKNALLAAQSGVVEAVHVKAGQRVAKNQLLISLKGK